MRVSTDRHRPTPMKRCREDGRGTVREILARNFGSIAVCSVGCFCVAMPIAFGVAGLGFWPLVIAYGGCLVGCALGGVVR